MNERTDYLSPSDNNIIVRSRLNAILSQAVKYPLVIVCAGAGYGKTRAVSDFIHESGIYTLWVQLSEFDNIESRFWKSYADAIRRFDPAINTSELYDFGFPDTDDKTEKYICMRNKVIANRKYILVFDDVHQINNPAVNRFIECLAHDTAANITRILICREQPAINLLDLEMKGLVFYIYEGELNFTESETETYLRLQGLKTGPDDTRTIYRDTNGWAFSVNLAAYCLKRSPVYQGYVRSALKQNIYKLIELEVWDNVSDQLKDLWARLSLIEHFSAELVHILARGNEGLLAEMKDQNAFMRYDYNINTYLVHSLFLNFLRTKQHLLTEDEASETYEAVADWCKQNDFIIDSLNYYEKSGDYVSIVAAFAGLPNNLPYDIAQYAIGIFERAPAEMFDKVLFLAARHLRIVASLGRFVEFFELVDFYERRFSKLPENNDFRNYSLCGIYHCCGYMRVQMSVRDGQYDFDKYFARMDACMPRIPIVQAQTNKNMVGPWVCAAGSSRQGAPQEFNGVVARSVELLSRYPGYELSGLDTLCQAELLFYQGDIHSAEPLINLSLERAREFKNFEIIHKALFYIMRIAVFQGIYPKVQKTLKDLGDMLEENEYLLRYNLYDIVLGWFYYILRLPEMVPDLLKEDFQPFAQPLSLENFTNQAKLRYYYITKGYPRLLAYIASNRHKDTILFGRVEMYSIEACARYQIGEKKMAFAALKDAYEAALPNNIIMPFIELGKDMRTITTAAMHDPECEIPGEWLKMINNKSAFYAKRQALIISNYQKDIGDGGKALSSRETEVLSDLYYGLTRSEVAVKQDLSINTVKLIIKNIYRKLNARNIIDLISIAAEQKLV